MKSLVNVGDRYGRLLILAKTEEMYLGRCLWICECDCGKTIKRTSASFRRKGRGTESCGCLLRDKITEKGRGLKDLSGQTFGRFTVKCISDKYDSTGHVKWECLCSCGKVRYHAGSVLKTGRVVSCGCHKNEMASEKCGDKHYNWKGGITPLNQAARGSQKFIDWRKSVFQRDDFRCQVCNNRGGTLNAHHLESFHARPDLRYEVSNGVTLCFCCHSGFHNKYGRLNNTTAQFEEYKTSEAT